LASFAMACAALTQTDYERLVRAKRGGLNREVVPRAQ
jgi:hypothetical protein